MDPLSAATYCDAYLQYLRQLSSHEDYVPKKEGILFEKLGNSVKEDKRLAEPVSHQLDYFLAIQAIDASLRCTSKVVCDAIDKFSKSLVTMVKSKDLTRKDMVDSLEKLKLKPLCTKMVAYLIPDDKVLTKEIHPFFLRGDDPAI